MSSLSPEQICQRLALGLQARIGDASNLDVAFQGAALGGSSDTAFVQVRWTGPDGPMREKMVLRREPSGRRIYPDPELDKQVQVMQALTRHPVVPVPQIVWFEPDGGLIGMPFFLMRAVEGETLTTYPSYHRTGWLADAAPQDRERLWRSGVEALTRVHRAPVEALGFLDRRELGCTGLQQELTYWDRFVRGELLAPAHPLLLTAGDWLQSNAPAKVASALSWGDARFGNMIFRDFQCVSVIDWETASLGGPEEDLGWWLLWDWILCDDMGLTRLEGLGDRKATIALWEAEMGRAAADMEYWDIFAAYRLGIAMERSVMLRTAAGVNPTNSPVGAGPRNPCIRRLSQLMNLPIEASTTTGG